MQNIKFTLALLLASLNLVAGEMKFELKDGTFVLDVKKNWAPFIEYIGMPLALVGPEYDGHRPAISITPTTWKKTLDPGQMAMSMDSYKSNRAEFVRSLNGKVEDFLPYTIFKLKTVSVAHHFGYRYTVNNYAYEEHSFLMECKSGQLYDAKVLAKGKQRSIAAQDGIKLLKTFKCEK